MLNRSWNKKSPLGGQREQANILAVFVVKLILLYQANQANWRSSSVQKKSHQLFILSLSLPANTDLRFCTFHRIFNLYSFFTQT